MQSTEFDNDVGEVDGLSPTSPEDMVPRGALGEMRRENGGFNIILNQQFPSWGPMDLQAGDEE